jgi:chromate transporter
MHVAAGDMHIVEMILIRKIFRSFFLMNQQPRPGAWKLFRIWTLIGLQSFGGGASTTFLIQRTFIEQYHWLTMEEFLHFWNLCILTPGINLVAVTVLIGKKLGGIPGIIASLAGMLVPSAAITCLLTALFTQIEHIEAVQAILQGVVPATGGIMLLVGFNFARPLVSRSRKVGMVYLLASGAVILACALAIILLKISVVIVIVGAVLIGAFFFSPRSHPPALEAGQGGEQ